MEDAAGGNGADVVRAPSPVSDAVAQYEVALLGVLESRGLPAEGVLVGRAERQKVFNNLDDVLEPLDAAHRARSVYLSKFVFAVGAGLFDAALNYLWDETISELRRRVAGYDLNYFFDLAVHGERRKRLKSAEDLPLVDDSELVQAANKMGLISDVGFKHLELVRYMRNYASAAHPNQTELTGIQLAGYMETCIREVITLPESAVVVEVRRLLANIKTTTMDAGQAKQVAATFSEIPADQVNSLAQGLFGIYVDPSTSEPTRDNVRLVLPLLWPFVDNDVKRLFGVRHARYVANHDADQAKWAREVLTAVDGLAYLTDDMRVAEIDEALDALMSAHHGFDNFYTEGPAVRRLAALVGTTPPAAVREEYVTSLVYLLLGNGSGTSWSADPVYRELIGNFSPNDARLALLSLFDLKVSSKLQLSRPASQLPALLDLLDSKVADAPTRALFDGIRDFTGSPESIRLDSNLKRLASEARLLT